MAWLPFQARSRLGKWSTLWFGGAPATPAPGSSPSGTCSGLSTATCVVRVRARVREPEWVYRVLQWTYFWCSREIGTAEEVTHGTPVAEKCVLETMVGSTQPEDVVVSLIDLSYRTKDCSNLWYVVLLECAAKWFPLFGRGLCASNMARSVPLASFSLVHSDQDLISCLLGFCCQSVSSLSYE